MFNLWKNKYGKETVKAVLFAALLVFSIGRAFAADRSQHGEGLRPSAAFRKVTADREDCFIIALKDENKASSEEYERVLERAGEIADYLGKAGEQLDKKRFGRARSYARRALEIDKDNTAALKMLARINKAEKAYREEEEAERKTEEEARRKAAEE
ncbi:MAG: hypothetical protein U9R44_05365, partial [Candidatus Omnitrophota bacterium]|nr:hypothetical protein [Candidatus Omnitrophota bacterium]